MKILSSVFENGGTIPRKYGMDFDNVNPPLFIEDVPEGAESLVLFMDDPDVPESAPVDVWDHWVVFNIPPTVTRISESWSIEGTRGKGTGGGLDYSGPRPPDGEHRYFFKLYALDTRLDLDEGVSKHEVLDVMGGHVIESAELIGRYSPQH